jgi:hypothetical protein
MSLYGEKSDFLGQLTEEIRGCGVSFYIWTNKSTQCELDWSSLTGTDYEKILENLPSKLCFLINHDTHDHPVKIWSSFLNLYRFVTLEIHEFSNIEDIFEKCKGWVNDFHALGSLGRKAVDSVTPYMHCLVYHVPFFTKKYGKLLRFSEQGIEKIYDEITNIYHSKTNKWDATVDILQVRKRIEHWHQRTARVIRETTPKVRTSIGVI